MSTPGRKSFNGRYILVNGKPVPEPDLIKWAMWMEKKKNGRILRHTFIGRVLVSTVFLGLDHGWNSPKPVLWETMIFKGKHDQEMWRYTSRRAALAGHRRAVKLVLKSKE